VALPMNRPTPARVADNAAFFARTLPGRDAALGSPGGADADTPLVAGWGTS
jgi:hypothetical protein